jgi:SLOG in TRPM, prokaryote
MRTHNIYFSKQQTLCVFPDERSDLAEAISVLGLEDNHPVIVLIGGDIDKREALPTRQAIITISKIAENLNAVVVCGGTDMGVMAEIGRMRWRKSYHFPLVGVAPEALVTWPGGPRSTKFLWWGKKRWQLEPHYSHFVLVPGSQFGDESPWIVDAATILSKGKRSVTILINGGEVSRKDIELSLESARPVIALSHTGRLADELSRQPNQHKLITVVSANVKQQIIEVIHAALSVNERSVLPQSLKEQRQQAII